MGNVIQFRKPSRPKPPDKDVIKLVKISDEFDAIILKHLVSGKVDPIDLAGLLAHRLGTLMRHIEEKSELWDVCEAVVKKQAAID